MDRGPGRRPPPRALSIRRHPGPRAPALQPPRRRRSAAAAASPAPSSSPPMSSPAASSEAAAAARSNRRPPIPSQPPPAPTFSAPDAGAGRRPPHRLTGQDRGTALRPARRHARRSGPSGPVSEGALVGVAGPTLRWGGATGSPARHRRSHAVDDRIELASLTKLFTAALVHRFADEGRDRPRRAAPAAGRPCPTSRTTSASRSSQLLAHTSGLINYLDTDDYSADPESVVRPGVRRHGQRGPSAGRRPGRRVPVLEHQLPRARPAARGRHRRGRSATFFATSTSALSAMRDTIHLAPAPAWPRGGTAGIETSLPDLLTGGPGHPARPRRDVRRRVRQR